MSHLNLAQKYQFQSFKKTYFSNGSVGENFCMFDSSKVGTPETRYHYFPFVKGKHRVNQSDFLLPGSCIWQLLI